MIYSSCLAPVYLCFFFNDTATTEIYTYLHTLSLHDALPIYKSYDFTIGFGAETDTLDAEGRIVATSDVRPTLADVEAVLPRFTGPIEQMPPAFSALKVDGRRAYDLARDRKSTRLNSSH